MSIKRKCDCNGVVYIQQYISNKVYCTKCDGEAGYFDKDNNFISTRKGKWDAENR